MFSKDILQEDKFRRDVEMLIDLGNDMWDMLCTRVASHPEASKAEHICVCRSKRQVLLLMADTFVFARCNGGIMMLERVLGNEDRWNVGFDKFNMFSSVITDVSEYTEKDARVILGSRDESEWQVVKGTELKLWMDENKHRVAFPTNAMDDMLIRGVPTSKATQGEVNKLLLQKMGK